mgnify:CR=1 FL=1
MLNLMKQSWLQGQSIVLIICLCGQLWVTPAQANDRSADIIASRPLLVERLLAPAGLSGQGQLVGLADSGLDKGSLSYVSGLITKLKPEAVTVKTPTGTIGVRGTQFLVNVDEPAKVN